MKLRSIGAQIFFARRGPAGGELQHHELRLDAADVAVGHDVVEGGFEQAVLAIHAALGAPHVQIADQPFAVFEHVVEVAGDRAVFDEGAAIQGAHIDETAYQVGRFLEVPVHFGVPGVGFLEEQGFQIVGGDTP